MTSSTHRTLRQAGRLTALAATCAATVALTSCSGQQVPTPSPASVTPSSASSAPTTQASTPDPSPSGSATSAAPTASVDPGSTKATKKSLTAVVKDDVMGNSIAFTSVVRGFPVPDKFESLKEDGELVLVEIDAKAGEKFSGGVQGGWKLLSGDGSVGTATTIADEAMTAAGYTPFDPPSRGESAKGWVAFQVNEKADNYTLVYKRMAASVIGSDQTIPAKTWQFPLS